MLILTDHKERLAEDWEAVRHLGQDEDPEMVERMFDMELDIDEFIEKAEKNRSKTMSAEQNEAKIKKSLLKIGEFLNLEENEESSDVLILAIREGEGANGVTDVPREQVDLLLARLGGRGQPELLDLIDTEGFEPPCWTVQDLGVAKKAGRRESDDLLEDDEEVRRQSLSWCPFFRYQRAHL